VEKVAEVEMGLYETIFGEGLR